MNADVRVSRGRTGIVEVEFDRPPHNHVDRDLVTSLANAMHNLDDDPVCRVVVLCSSGRHFCAGANLSPDEGQSAGVNSTRQNPMDFYNEVARLFTTKKPIVAAVQGRAVGGGVGLSFVADFRVVSPETVFAVNFARLGIHPGFAITETLPPLVGQQAASHIMMTGRDVAGEEAVRIGMADRVVGPEEIRSKAHDLATELLAGAPLAVLSIRAKLRRGLGERVVTAMRHEAAEQTPLRFTEDFIEGVSAIRERRVPGWSGK